MNNVSTLPNMHQTAMHNAKMFFTAHKQTVLALIVVVLMTVLFCGMAEASTTTTTGAGNEFNATASKFDGWIKGGLGKTAALLALGVGLIVAAVKKDWSWLGGGIAVAIVAGVAGSIISASFSAVI